MPEMAGDTVSLQVAPASSSAVRVTDPPPCGRDPREVWKFTMFGATVPAARVGTGDATMLSASSAKSPRMRVARWRSTAAIVRF